jgi:hypothetical protein
MKLQTKDRGYDNVLPDQDYHTSQGAVMDEYRESEELRLKVENESRLQKYLLQSHVAHLGLKLLFQCKQPAPNLLNYVTEKFNLFFLKII